MRLIPAGTRALSLLVFAISLPATTAAQSARALATGRVTGDGDRVTLNTSGMRLKCSRATVQESGREVVVRMANP